MSGERIRHPESERLLRVGARLALVAVLVGVFCTWVSVGDVTLSGVEGPNDGWLVAILAGLSFIWVRSMGRGSWVGVVGVVGAAAVIVWTALSDAHDARAVLDASVEYGLVLVVAAGGVLAATGLLQGALIARKRGGRRP